MTCPNATGACTVVADTESCIAPKGLVSLAAIQGTFIQGTDTGFTVTWNTSVLYPLENVRILCRLIDGVSYYPIEFASSRDDGTFTATYLSKGDIADMWIRPETPTTRGNWVYIPVIADSTWNQDTKLVTHLTEPVIHTNEAVSYTP